MTTTCSKQEEETLECGTSLAEREFVVVVHPRRDGGGPPPRGAGDAGAGAENEMPSASSVESLRSLIASDVLTDAGGGGGGNNSNPFTTFASPFEDPRSPPGSGLRTVRLPMVYCDQTASNRPVRSVESYLERVCLPFYGNTHTNTSVTGSQSTAFVAEARQVVAECCNAKVAGKSSTDVVMFAGHGTTSAVELLVDCLGLRYHNNRADDNSNSNRPVVFVGPHEHHSNLIPWRESGCEIVMVPESAETGRVDVDRLGRLLEEPMYRDRTLKMGTFTAASNVTGAVADVDEIAACLHGHGALAFFDYATAAPYVPIDMNPVVAPSSSSSSSSAAASASVSKDAVFLSPHKMLGGVGAPGVLIVKKHLVSQVNAPARSGGGTVFYVTNTHHRFLKNRIERYEGGTPNVPGIIRVGLAFLLKRQAEEKYRRLSANKTDSGSGSGHRPSSPLADNAAGSIDSVPPTMLEYEYLTHRRVSSYLREHAPNLILLGSGGTSSSDDDGRHHQQHLPIFSFLVRYGRRFLHYNYVCAILNDVFGIQSRGGCQCAGPYSQRLLGLTEMTADGDKEVPNQRNRDIEEALLKFKERAELLRPGYTRLSLPFKGLRSEEVEYVMKALVWVSKHGWALMSQYRCNHRTGEWRHWNRQGRPLGKTERRWLGHYDFTSAALHNEEAPSSSVSRPDSDGVRGILEDAMSNADAILRAAMSDQRSIAQALKMSDADSVLGTGGDDKLEELRWYVYPRECALDLSRQCDSDAFSLPASVEEVLGALNPVEKCCGSKDVRPALEPQINEGHGSSEEYRKFEASKVVFFRDGEHTGEATVEEIRDGVDEGELSERCQIYDAESDAWVTVSSLVSEGREKESDLPSIEASSEETGHHQPPRKKETRDSRIWGTGEIVEAGPAAGPSMCELKPMLTDEAGSTTEASTPSKATKKKRTRHVKPPPKLMRLCTQAMIQFEMLEDGDRLLLGLSGGKDSLSLLHCLMEFQRKLPIKFEIEVCTIDPMTPSFDPSPLIPYVESLGLKYHYIRDDIVSRASTAGKDGKMVSSLCSFCARMKRGNLYNCARKNNCNKLVLAQHLDDCAESFMMSVMHNGFLRTMKAHYKINAGDISVIRPLVYCRESLMTDFAREANLPVINENCPACFEEPKERARVKKMLSREETLYPNFYDNIKRSLLPLMHDDMTSILHCYTEQTLSKSRKDNQPKRRKRQREEDVLVKPDEKERHPANQAPPASLRDFSDDDLVLELARRKAQQYRLAGAMKRIGDGAGAETQPDDPTGQVCCLTGGNGAIRCYELME